MSKFKFTEEFALVQSKSASFKAEESYNSQSSLLVTADVIHATTTDNFTYYSPNELKKSCYSWTEPYQRPVLTHHNIYEGEPIGRVTSATYIEASSAGTPCIRTTAEITDQDAIQKVKDGRYKTISVGGSADSVRCSICGQDLTEDWCEHERGQIYDNRVCVWLIEDIQWDEWSFVNRPADVDAMVIDMEDKTRFNQSRQESHLWSGQSIPGTFQHSRKGGSSMPKLEEQLTRLQEDNKTLQSKVDSITEENKTLTQQVSEKETELTNTIAEKESLNTKVQEMTASIEEFQSKIAELEKTVVTMTSEKEELEEKCKNLEEQAHLQLATRVVETKIACGRLKEEELEEQIKDHVTRTKESLSDSLKDLQEELKLIQQGVPKVHNPGVVTTQESNVQVAENDQEDLSEIEKTRIALKKAFSGKY